MLLQKYLYQFGEALRRDATAAKMSAGAALGFLLGFTPVLTLQGVFLLLLTLAVRVNLAAFLLSVTFSSLLYWCLQPVLHLLGYWLLTGIPSLHGIWAWAAHLPMIPLTRFNYTVVMGALATSLCMVVPIYWIVKYVVLVFGDRIHASLSEWGRQFSWGALRLVRNYVQYLPENRT